MLKSYKFREYIVYFPLPYGTASGYWSAWPPHTAGAASNTGADRQYLQAVTLTWEWQFKTSEYPLDVSRASKLMIQVWIQRLFKIPEGAKNLTLVCISPRPDPLISIFLMHLILLIWEIPAGLEFAAAWIQKWSFVLISLGNCGPKAKAKTEF